jgi:pimeloyl-ACP methyl ester carboxylesterase
MSFTVYSIYMLFAVRFFQIHKIKQGRCLGGLASSKLSYTVLPYFNEEQLNSVSGKVLFLDGESDPLGDMEKVKAKMERYHMEYRFFSKVGHGVNHEISDEINKIIIQYFNQPVAKQGNH